jgi:cytosine/adenosine deaminase-related metal-dependent hydrolase
MEHTLGQIAPGYAADLQVISTDAAHMFPLYNPYSALVYSANASDVDCVMADGNLVVEHHELTQWSLPALREELMRAMSGFYQAAEKYREII